MNLETVRQAARDERVAIGACLNVGSGHGESTVVDGLTREARKSSDR